MSASGSQASRRLSAETIVHLLATAANAAKEVPQTEGKVVGKALLDIVSKATVVALDRQAEAAKKQPATATGDETGSGEKGEESGTSAVELAKGMTAVEVAAIIRGAWVALMTAIGSVMDEPEWTVLVLGKLARAMQEHLESIEDGAGTAGVVESVLEHARKHGLVAEGIVDGAPAGAAELSVRDTSLVGVWLKLLFSGSAFDKHGDVRLRCNTPGCDCLVYRHNAANKCAQCEHSFTAHTFGILSISRVLESISELVSQHEELFWGLMLSQCSAFGGDLYGFRDRLKAKTEAEAEAAGAGSSGAGPSSTSSVASTASQDTRKRKRGSDAAGAAEERPSKR
ncbi:uncharacterized protein AMSG_03145 [Thecamonas trahens ATCC 50062]|uniref:Uncharacterized protein n=1 Tax=Thecamonas trahens ATCC 50062 TaxID=461836 RepID=A0A0L0D323_THETB|nr:hypothetical protein AMSG_03145 [Thecamonas trahens ATCC 50062]KNC46709.1 hypothetical protein AMSG_03145 [Thecamonas trahens ATCC 50062]|eukprot:XP_013760474.1 hypothetical protein AMSG_03145 [Thecamonas trahens ATCC 50062]